MAVYVEESLMARFRARVFKDYGKTSGGAVSRSVEKALESYLKS